MTTTLLEEVRWSWPAVVTGETPALHVGLRFQDGDRLLLLGLAVAQERCQCENKSRGSTSGLVAVIETLL